MDGIIGASPEQTMQNIGILSAQRMNETDRTILEIMLEKNHSQACRNREDTEGIKLSYSRFGG